MTSPEPSPGSWHFTVVRTDSFIRGGSFRADGEGPSYAHMPLLTAIDSMVNARWWSSFSASSTPQVWLGTGVGDNPVASGWPAMALISELWAVSTLGGGRPLTCLFAAIIYSHFQRGQPVLSAST